MKKDIKRYLERSFRPVRKDLSFDKLFQSVIPYFEKVDTPVSLGLFLRLKYGEYSQYLDFEIDPSAYTDSYAFEHDYQCAKMFSKSMIFPSIYDTKKEAERSFIEAEQKCLETNNRFSKREDPDFRDPAVCSILHIATRKISRILGDCPRLEDLSFRFGPGNVVGLSKETDVSDKLAAVTTVTPSLMDKLDLIWDNVPGWSCHRPDKVYTSLYDYTFTGIKVVEGSKLGFVPKNAKTDRAICTEPLMNSFVQLGVGDYMFDRLRRTGCNLRDQSRNQKLAKLGSETNKLATIDLSSASDTISYMTVLELLPLPWFDLLNDCRSSQYTYQGRTYSFEKFSSMGNGFTFPLETLIFLGVSRAVCSFLDISADYVSVYGDDIIVPVEAVELLEKVLSFLGFSVNTNKSFSDGPFRESCGEDWFLGVPVRPVFFKKPPSNEQIISWANSVYRRSCELQDPKWACLHGILMDICDPQFKILRGPDGFGNGHFVLPREVGYTNIRSSHRRRGWEGFPYYTLSSSPIPRSRRDWSVMSSALYLAQFITSPICINGQYDNLHMKLEMPSDSLSHTRNGVYMKNTRRRTRTVLRRAFHPWD